MRILFLILGLKRMCNYLFFTLQVFLAKNKQEDQFYAIKVLNKAAIRKRNEVCYLADYALQYYRELGKNDHFHYYFSSVCLS